MIALIQHLLSGYIVPLRMSGVWWIRKVFYSAYTTMVKKKLSSVCYSLVKYQIISVIGNPRCSVDSRSSVCARGHHNLFNSSVIITIMWASQPDIVIIIALSHHHMIIIIVIIKWAQPPDLWCIKRQLNITSPTAIKAGEPMSTCHNKLWLDKVQTFVTSHELV